MSEAVHPAEIGARAWQEAIRSDAALAGEFERSAAEFFGTEFSGAPRPPRDELGRRRHLEWFVLERENKRHGGLLVQTLPDLEARFRPEELASWIGSVVGVFEVSSIQPGLGVWLKDLAGGGEYPLIEPAGSALMQVGDLIAGRIFAHDGAFVASPAAAFVRQPDLLQALREDLLRAREGRRGTVRIAQSEIERLFHAQRESTEGAIDRARELLRSGGVEDDDADELLAELAQVPFCSETLTPGAHDPLGRALDLLAFETDIDLESARRVLLAAWQELSERGPGKGKSLEPAAGPAGGLGTMSSRTSASAEPSVGKPRDPADALAEFDSNRARGLSLDQSFRELELALGLEPGDEEDPGLVPAFPEAMAAILEEYAWETQAAPEERAVLAPLATYAAQAGVEDELNQQHWIDFTCRWMLEEDRLSGASAAEAFSAALVRFVQWAEHSQALTLWPGAQAHARSLQKSLPRLAELNQRRTRRTQPGEGSIWRVSALSGELATLEGSTQATIDPMLALWLRSGDLVRGEVREGRLALYAAYPRYEPETAT
jgi:hypothetical protein